MEGVASESRKHTCLESSRTTSRSTSFSRNIGRHSDSPCRWQNSSIVAGTDILARLLLAVPMLHVSFDRRGRSVRASTRDEYKVLQDSFLLISPFSRSKMQLRDKPARRPLLFVEFNLGVGETWRGRCECWESA